MSETQAIDRAVEAEEALLRQQRAPSSEILSNETAAGRSQHLVHYSGTSRPTPSQHSNSSGSDVHHSADANDMISGLRLELITAHTNNEILQGNVETLKSLSLQLAVQLEEANIKLSTSEEHRAIANLRAERDHNMELDTLRLEYEKRLEALRTALRNEEEALKQTVAMWENREEAAEKRLLALERDKDRVISSLQHEVEVLRQGLDDGIFRGYKPALRSQPAAVPSSVYPYAQGVPQPSLGRQSSQLSNLVVLTVALPTQQADCLRFGEDERLPHSVGLRKRKFLVDIVADPSLLESLETFPDASPLPQQQSSGSVAQSWGFRLPTGEKIILRAEVVT